MHADPALPVFLQAGWCAEAPADHCRSYCLRRRLVVDCRAVRNARSRRLGGQCMSAGVGAASGATADCPSPCQAGRSDRSIEDDRDKAGLRSCDVSTPAGATTTRAPAGEPSCSARRWLVPALGVSGNCYIVRTYFDHRGMLSINPWRGRAGCGNDVGQATPPAPSSRDLHHSAYPARLSQR